jgi:hypothetical protein
VKQSEAVKLQTFLQLWRATHQQLWRQGVWAVANDLIGNAAFMDIKFAGVLESPIGASITQLVESALPFPGSAETAVMVEAIEIAARKKSNDQVVGTLAVGVLIAVVIWGLLGEFRLNGRGR